MTSAATPTPLGDSKNGGALFTLPREMRDEIYRLLVERCYIVLFPSKSASGATFVGKTTAVDIFDLAILQTSHAVSHEVREVLYSRSTFRYFIDFTMIVPRKLPTALVNRMKKVEIFIGGLVSKWDLDQKTHPTYKDRIAAICEATIDDFTGTQNPRDICHIQLPAFRVDMIEPLQSYILPKLAAFHGFGTLLVELSFEKELACPVRTEAFMTREYKQAFLARYQPLGEAMKDAMEPTLGPATISDDGSTIRLVFHPREHVPSLFGA